MLSGVLWLWLWTAALAADVARCETGLDLVAGEYALLVAQRNSASLGELLVTTLRRPGAHAHGCSPSRPWAWGHVTLGVRAALGLLSGPRALVEGLASGRIAHYEGPWDRPDQCERWGARRVYRHRAIWYCVRGRR